MCFSCFYHSKYHNVYFFYDYLFFVSIIYQLIFEENQVHIYDWHIVGKQDNWLNFIWPKTWRAIEEIS